MTRTANARVAGATFLIYIAAGITSLMVFRRASAGDGIAARLASMSAHGGEMSAYMLLLLVQVLCALVLGVTLYAVTRDEDRDIAMFGLVCRAAEGINSAISLSATLALVWLATASGPTAPDMPSAHTLARYLMQNDVAVSGTFFAVGSTAFCYLFLRGRMIPVPLAWLGVVASVILVIALPLVLAGLLRGPVAMAIWLPMLLFEVPFGFWLLVKGVRP
jgi:hypothetical protein